jgi:hypothetical protein
MERGAQLIEMEEALEAANKCSEGLEHLLSRSKAAGGATPELYSQIVEANDQCEKDMRRYIDAYRAYYNAGT